MAREEGAIPMGVAAEEMIAGVANYYATTCGGCASACSLVVKQRDGRPIKIEGNPAHPAWDRCWTLSVCGDCRTTGSMRPSRPTFGSMTAAGSTARSRSCTIGVDFQMP